MILGTKRACGWPDGKWSQNIGITRWGDSRNVQHWQSIKRSILRSLYEPKEFHYPNQYILIATYPPILDPQSVFNFTKLSNKFSNQYTRYILCIYYTTNIYSKVSRAQRRFWRSIPRASSITLILYMHTKWKYLRTLKTWKKSSASLMHVKIHWHSQ